jgi:hypothetical protein
MKTKAESPESSKDRMVSVASVVLAFSLFGFWWPHQDSTKGQQAAAHPKGQDSQNIALPRDSHPGWGPVSF